MQNPRRVPDRVIAELIEEIGMSGERFTLNEFFPDRRQLRREESHG